ncbi:hypothetical protein OIU76_013226 [Salix suchowensis]|nr:hypothetical protein OIU76_013226 [Salix suchowensis]
MAASQASLLLQKQLRNLCKNPVDGFSAGLIDENNVFEWSVTIIGPPDTLYEGGFFNAIMSFPQNYPVSPPTVRFTSEVWHPNVYANGKVCISILHPPGDDPNGYELATERWTPVHTVCDSLMFYGYCIYYIPCSFYKYSAPPARPFVFMLFVMLFSSPSEGCHCLDRQSITKCSKE